MDHAWGSADEWAAVKKVAVDKVSVVLGVFKSMLFCMRAFLGRLAGLWAC